MRIMAFPQVEGYNVLERIGSGGFSTVYKGQKKTGDKQIVAIKCVDKRCPKMSLIERAISEISLLKMVNCEYIVKLIDFSVDPKSAVIITSYCDGGDLSHYIRKKHKLSEPLVKMFMQHLALALKYLNRLDICHMDLKPQNLLLCTQPKLHLKVADFGLSQILSPENAEIFRYAGSLHYMAPEKLLNQKYDTRVDLWSVGIIIYECLFGRTPFLNCSRKFVFDFMIKRTPIELPKTRVVSPLCLDLLFRLLKYNPDDRIGFKDFYKHEFLSLYCLPTKENYLATIELVQEAIILDELKFHADSLPKYREAIKYLEGFIPAEQDLFKKAILETRLAEYKKWAGTLEQVVQKNIAAPRIQQKMLPLAETHLKILYKLCATTPKLITALDLGTAAEMYLADEHFHLALQKFKAALNILIPLLNTEPEGPRRDMLHAQVQKWLSVAESINL